MKILSSLKVALSTWPCSRWQSIIIFLLIIVGMLVRVWQFGELPKGLTWDEAAIGYNGWSVINYRRDEWLDFLPISFRSFGDYKAPLAIYINGIFTSVFGISHSSIRLPFLLFSFVAIMFWLIFLWQLNLRKIISNWGVVVGVGLFSLSPWHVLFSRTGFESGIALSLIMMSLVWIMFYWNTKKWWWLILLASSLALSLYAYHSAKIVIPLLMLSAGIWFGSYWRDSFNIKRKQTLLSTVLFFSTFSLLLIPLLLDSLLGQGATRANSLVIFQDILIEEKIEIMTHSVVSSLSPGFWLFGYGDSLRHVTGKYGPLSPASLFLLIIGLILSLKNLFVVLRIKKIKIEKRIQGFLIFWLGIGLLPAFLSQDAPHANRTLLALPAIYMLAVIGFEWLLKQSKNVKKMIISLIILIEVGFFALFLLDYFGAYQIRGSLAFAQGYDEVYQISARAEKQEPPFEKVENIYISSKLGQPYIYALLYLKVRPIDYHSGRLVRYLFPDEITVGDLSRKNALLIYSVKDDVPVVPQGVISNQAGEPLWFWYVTDAGE